MDINDRNLLLNDIIYKLPILLNKDAFKSTMEIIILSLGVDLDESNKTQKDTPINTSTNTSQKVNPSANKKTKTPVSNMFDDDMEPLDEESKQSLNELLKEDVDVEVDNILKNAIISETPPSEFEFDKNTGTIVEYLGTSAEITMPEKIEGIPVKIIGDSSFKDIGIEKINIPMGIEYIRSSAFSNNKIETLLLPNSLKSIGDSAFENNQISDLTLSDAIKSIEEGAFCNNKIRELNLPYGVVSIGGFAFSRNQIRELNLPNRVESIGKCAFTKNQIRKLTLPNSLKSIEKLAFDSRVDFEVRKFLKNKEAKQNRESEISKTPPPEFEFDKTTGTIVKYLGASKVITIPEKIQGVPVKIIGDSSFRDIGIEKINIPFGIEKIGNLAFYCNNISDLTLPDGIEKIGESAFKHNKIETLLLPNGLKYIGEWAFSDNKISKLTLPDGVESIGEYAFIFNKLKEVYLPESIYWFADKAFDPFVKLKKKSFFNKIFW